MYLEKFCSSISSWLWKKIGAKLSCALNRNVPVLIHLPFSVNAGSSLGKVWPWCDTSMALKVWLMDAVSQLFLANHSQKIWVAQLHGDQWMGTRIRPLFFCFPFSFSFFFLHIWSFFYWMPHNIYEKIIQINWSYGYYFPSTKISICFWKPSTVRVRTHKPNLTSDWTDLDINFSLEDWSVSVFPLFSVQNPQESLLKAWHLYQIILLNNFGPPIFPTSPIRLLKACPHSPSLSC